MKHLRLAKDMPFETLDIPYPAGLETAEDYAQLPEFVDFEGILW